MSNNVDENKDIDEPSLIIDDQEGHHWHAVVSVNW